ncbi:GntR family transcriptional regulator [Pseudonocardia spirodelae]|uniref:GntR family transcriptional regulator n=1 Tax=Pseudonocardia spirodelae TaxID=3133431 RepID=A0ABU8T1T6_9PSEU
MTTDLEVRSLVDAVTRALRERILRGDLAAGAAVTEKLVAEEFAVARPTAKAAVERLVFDGLLRRQANRTARVPVLTLAEVSDVYFSRILLERAAIEVVAGHGRVPDDARIALGRFDLAFGRGDVSAVVEADVAFHQALVDAAGSPRLSRMYASLMAEFHLCVARVQVLGRLDRTRLAAEHAAVLAAVEEGDAGRASGELTAHITGARDRILAVYAEDS